jgi:hypothetical protein
MFKNKKGIQKDRSENKEYLKTLSLFFYSFDLPLHLPLVLPTNLRKILC